MALYGGDRCLDGLGGGDFLAAESRGEAAEVEMNHRRREEGQQLAQRQTADHRVAERLAELGAAGEPGP